MRFGEYLVQIGAATEQEVLAALAAQRRREVFLPMLAVELRLLSAAKAFYVQKLASAQGKGFLDTVAEQGNLTTDGLEKLAAAYREAVPPLGQFLVDMGVLTIERLDARLAAYADLEAKRRDVPI